MIHENVLNFVSVLNHRNHELRVRLNLGLEWGKNLVGKNKIFKGYKPNRRYLQVNNFEAALQSNSKMTRVMIDWIWRTRKFFRFDSISISFASFDGVEIINQQLF